jgi:cysteine synthase A
LLANALGYRCVVVIPETQSKEKQDLLDLYGADLRVVPATSYDDPKHYIHTAGALAEKLKTTEQHGVIWAQQFDNTANCAVHRQTTGEEIWQQTGGKLDGFICSAGTGGTLAGVSQALKAHNKDLTIALADPMGSGLYNYIKTGELQAEGSSVAEGIGVNFLTNNMKAALVDKAYKVTDKEALPYIFNLLKHEGICLGGSSAINIAGAVQMASDLGPGHTIVTILCDYGDRYLSKIYNPTFLRRQGLPAPDWII